MNPFDLIIVTNSAGELSAYVKPTVERIQEKVPQARVILILTPCQYATGREIEEAKSFPGVFDVIIPEEYTRWMLKGNLPQGITFREKGLVLYMGGDMLHAVFVSKKLKFPAMAYTQKHAQWAGQFRAFLVPDESTREKLLKKGILSEKVKVVGDLMVDSVPRSIDAASAAARWKLDLGKPVISMMPGSRPFQTDYMLPFFLETAKMIQKVVPEAQVLMVLSPYIMEEDIKRSLKGDGAIYSQGDLRFIQTKSGTRVEIVNDLRHDAVAISKLVLTIPGTNTAQVAALGVPMIVTFPLDHPERIPLTGIADWLCRIPVLGMLLKKWIVKAVSARTKFFALPNIKAGREIVPEFRGKVSPKEVAGKALNGLKDEEWLKETSRELKAAMGEGGAAGRITEEILRIMENS